MCKKINLEDIFLFDPFTNKERLRNLNLRVSPDEFFASYYCAPFFCEEGILKSEADEDDLSHRADEDEVMISELVRKKKEFEKYLYDGRPLLYIRGYSGSGKSVYLNYILFHLLKNERKAYVFNLDESTNIVERANTKLYINYVSKSGHPSASWLFAGKILEETYDIIIETLETANQEVITGIQKQYEYLKDKEIGGNDNLFALFIKNDDTLNIEAKQRIFNGLKSLMCEREGEIDIDSVIQGILEVLTKFLFCYIKSRELVEDSGESDTIKK